MSGKVIGIGLAALALLAGSTLYYLQEYAYYREVQLAGAGDGERRGVVIEMVSLTSGVPEAIPADDFRGIDADNAPIRFRACFRVPMSLPMLSETFEIHENPTPLIGPSWFDCFDARAIGQALEEGRAVAFLSRRNIHDGVDRVIAVFPDGRAYAWHQLNEKFEKKAPFDARSSD